MPTAHTKRRTRGPNKVKDTRRMVRYDSHRWEVKQDRGTYLLIERGRGSYAMWLHHTLAVARSN